MTLTEEAKQEVSAAVVNEAFHANREREYDGNAAREAFKRLSDACDRHGITISQARALHWNRCVAADAERRAKEAAELIPNARRKIAAARISVHEHAVGIRIATAINDAARVSRLRTAIAVERARQRHAMGILRRAGGAA